MLVRDATLADGRGVDVRTADGRIAAVEPAGSLAATDGEAVRDARGRLLLPGGIDAHVHFREPGFEGKETWGSGSRAAAAGGVTTVVDQPNTDPATVDGPAFDAKARRASDSVVDYGLSGGVTPDWHPDSLFDRPIAALGEVFLADSTGDMGIDRDRFADALDRAADRNVLVTVHAEDASLFDPGALDTDAPDRWSAYRPAEAEIAAVEDACAMAAERDAALHVAHTSTPEAVNVVRDADVDADAPISCEVTPHHLLLSRDDAAGLGTFGRMNPPLRSDARRAALLDRAADGRVDCVATDHAPHTRAEKDAPLEAVPSGVPGVETMRPLLLAAARRGAVGGVDVPTAIDTERVRDLTATGPARVLGLERKGRIAEGADADLALFADDARPIRGADGRSKCDWTPFEGWAGVEPVWTSVRGGVVYERDPDRDRSGEPVGTNAFV